MCPSFGKKSTVELNWKMKCFEDEIDYLKCFKDIASLFASNSRQFLGGQNC